MAVNRALPEPSRPSGEANPLEVSIVMPCLNEEATLPACIRKAQAAIAQHGLRAEIIVADNGSKDNSRALARAMGAQVVIATEPGYGSAIRAGIEAAHGEYIIIGDADDSYDFSGIYPFIEKLRSGSDLVIGNRFKGGIDSGAMPWKHRYLGNPVLTGIGRIFFKIGIGDFHCGLRGLRKDAYQRMQLLTTGMEFASEMVIKAALKGMTLSEIPTPLHKDGRPRPPHLRSFRDGWRHLRFMLLFSPRWLFFIPGSVLLITGLIMGGWLLTGPKTLAGFGLDIHTLLVCAIACLTGYQAIVFGLFTKFFAIREGFHPPNPLLERLNRHMPLELGLVLGIVLTLLGLGLLISATLSWGATGFGALDPRITMRVLIPAVVLIAFGVQTVFAAFFLSVLTIAARRPDR